MVELSNGYDCPIFWTSKSYARPMVLGYPLVLNKKNLLGFECWSWALQHEHRYHACEQTDHRCPQRKPSTR